MTHVVRNALIEEFSASVVQFQAPENALGQKIGASATGLHSKVLALIKNSDVIKVKAYTAAD